jgi:transmembrane sensor
MSETGTLRELITAQALQWFVAHRSSELTAQQREEFIDWLRASPLHAREYLALTGLSEDLRHVAQEFTTPTEALIAQAHQEANAEEVVRPLFATQRSRTSPPPRRQRWVSWAAAASLSLVAVALGVWMQGSSKAGPAYSTAHAEQRSWRMPDGSTVHLNSGSKIKVRFDQHSRVVDLIEGQALFQVAKDARRPFWVHAGDTVIKAVGTEFDVYRQPQRTLVSVVEGRVAILRNSASLAQLNAGQQVAVSRENAVVSEKPEEVRKTVAWLQRQVVFDHDPLSVAVEEFNRYSDARIRIDDASLRNTEVSGIFSAYDAEAFIRFLEHQPDMRVNRSGAEISVTAATPR